MISFPDRCIFSIVSGVLQSLHPDAAHESFAILHALRVKS
jgi:hypothetical protein